MINETKKIERIHPKDEKWMHVLPEDPNFDPERNKEIIEKTIRETEANMRLKEREHDEGIRERASATARYIQSLQQGRGNASVEKYFGRRYLARLRGEDIVKRLKETAQSGGQIIRQAENV